MPRADSRGRLRTSRRPWADGSRPDTPLHLVGKSRSSAFGQAGLVQRPPGARADFGIKTALRTVEGRRHMAMKAHPSGIMVKAVRNTILRGLLLGLWLPLLAAAVKPATQAAPQTVEAFF